MIPATFWKSSAAAVFNPATLPLSLWVKAPYGGAPWSANASTGGSGTVPLATSGIDPTVGTSLNGKATAAFAGASSQSLRTGTANNVLFSASGGAGWVLFNATSIPTTGGAAYTDGTFFTDPSDGDTTFGLTSAGLSASILTGAGYMRVNVTFSTTGSWHLFQWKWDGTTLKARVDSGAYVTMAAGNVNFAVVSNVSAGVSYAGIYFDGLIAEMATSASAISDANLDNVKSYVNATYSLAL